ncbi:pyridoxamine 5'-phosphate oxidase family protein [Millisia brevis]|uniref:pyridoxamine 5'-phosphate oxidase family protein n=1 Tax=Millisia brevis TaxID=264148 RepID=UPI00082A7E1D|nr:pyridoxamine 5'-phosphate oxidase family protein [Millisia brevis]
MSTQPRQLTRKKDRGLTDRTELYDILDSTLVGTLTTVDADGLPVSVPVLYARDGDRILVHGSTGAGAFRRAAHGAPVAFCVAEMDALVVAATLFDSSANYRSAVVNGVARTLDGDSAVVALTTLSEVLLPGRTTEVRGHLPKEVAATLVLALDIVDGEWTAKRRVGGAGDGPEPGVWRGVVPVVRGWGAPIAEAGTDAEVPASVRDLIAG